MDIGKEDLNYMITYRQCDCISTQVKIVIIPPPKKKKKKKTLAKSMKSHIEDKNTKVNSIPVLNAHKK